jgi:hypothetical protein
MNSEAVEVCIVLGPLSSKISESRDMLSNQNIANALYGLQGMNSRVPEVSSVLRALCGKMSESKNILNAQHIV